jgi:hypothetical protein
MRTYLARKESPRFIHSSGRPQTLKQREKMTGNRRIENWMLPGSHAQAKLRVSQPQDFEEREADRVAEQVMRTPSGGPMDLPHLGTAGVQRKCDACKGGKKCPKCEEEENSVLRRKESQAPGSENEASVPSSFLNGLGAGQPLAPSLRGFLEPRYGYDFGSVRIHTDSAASKSADAINAVAYAAAPDIAFAQGQFNPSSRAGLRLLSHELAHVVQQGRESSSVGRKESIMREPAKPGKGAKTSAPAQKSAARPTVRMHFDGSDLIVYEGDTEKFRFSGHSGRPILINEEDAKNCGGDVRTDTYLDDKRYVGVKDHGPIPEGTYALSPPGIERFTAGEQWDLLWGGITGKKAVQVHGSNIHPGDWGSGRVELIKQGRVSEGPCGNANKRSEFFLHGGLLAGSSGCIDIGGDFSALADFLDGYGRNVSLTVKYEHGPSSVYFFRGLGGAIAYQHGFQFAHGPKLRLGTEFDPGSTRFLVSPGYEGIARWAGGAAALGLKLDIPMNDREAFVRAGLTSTVNFKLLGSLYGQLTGGIDVNLSTRRFAGEVGGGLGYDFGRVQLEALYNMLLPLSQNDARTQQVLLGVGFRFH